MSYQHTALERTSDPESIDKFKDDEKRSVEPVEQAARAEADLPLAEQKPPAPTAGNPGQVPNGGLQAWLQVVGGWMLFFNTWGILNTFGVYQTYYESGQLFTETSSNISWIGSVQALAVLLVGAVVGPVYDRGHLRFLLLIGSFGVVFGHMMLSLCHEFWQCILAQGFCIGMGAGCLFVPALAILPPYFNTKLGLAIGLAASGSSMGGIIYPIMFYRLIDEVGFGWGVRILGFTALATLIIPLAVMKMRVKPGKARSLIDTTAFTDIPFMTFVLGGLIGFIGLYVGIFYISYFGAETGYTNASLSFYLVPILNAGSVFGRTLPNWLSDKIGPTNVIVPGSLVVGILLFCMLAVHNAGGLIVTTLLFGFFSGIFIALPPVIIVGLTADKSKVGTRIGMGFAMMGLGALAGGPGAGAILSTGGSNPEWTGMFAFGGASALAATCIFVVVRLMRSGPKLMVKA